MQRNDGKNEITAEENQKTDENVFVDIDLNENEINDEINENEINEVISLVTISSSDFITFDNEELELLQINLQHSLPELQNILDQHRKIFWYYKTKYYLALGLNLLYLPFQINTSKEGIQNFVQCMRADLEVSDAVGFGIGVPIAIFDFLVYLLAFSPHKEAVQTTLAYHLRTPWKVRMKNFYLLFKEEPKQVIKNLLQNTFNKTLLLNVNLTGSISYVTDFPWKRLPIALRGSLLTTILALGNEYHNKYDAPNYFEGLSFWFNNKEQPWLVNEVLRGNICVPLQIFFQGIVSIVGLRSYPFYYYLVLAAQDLIGWWPPMSIVLLGVTWHSLCAYYPTSYNYYLGNRNKISRILREKIDTCLLEKTVRERLLQLTIANLNDNEFQSLVNEYQKAIIFAEENLVRKKIEREYGRYLIGIEKTSFIPIIYRAVIGGYLAYIYLRPLLKLTIYESMILNSLSVILGASVLATITYRAEQTRIMDKLIVKELEQNESTLDQLTTEKEASSSCAGVTQRVMTNFLNLCNGISNYTSTIGVLNRCFQNPSSLMIAMFALVGGDSTVNNFVFNEKKIFPNIKSAYRSFVSSVPLTFFWRSHKVDVNVDNEKSETENNNKSYKKN